MNFIKFNSLKSWSAYLSSLPADHQTFSEDTNILGNGHLGQFDGIKEPKPEKITKFSITLFPGAFIFQTDIKVHKKLFLCRNGSFRGLTSCDRVLVSILLRGRNYIIFGSRSDFARFK